MRHRFRHFIAFTLLGGIRFESWYQIIDSVFLILYKIDMLPIYRFLPPISRFLWVYLPK